MVFRSLALHVVVGSGGILLSTLLSAAQPIEERRQSENGASLVDLTAGKLHDGWGNAAVETLPIYYPAQTGQGAVEMLSFRPSFLPVFDWGMRATRTVSAGSEGKGSSSSIYWYGGVLFPLVITRDGADYRLLGKSVVEEADSDRPARSYLRADHLGSVRMATDDQGQVVQSLSYDDYGLTRIAGESSAAAEDSVATFYRFQGQEQEIFPLAKLGIENDALARWLDQIGLYHFPWRDYAAGLASFTQTDPIPTEDSLYAALRANPVNFTDETGGMLEEGLPQRRYASLKRVEIGALTNIDPEAQMLLDRIVADPNATFSSAQVDKMRLAHYSVLYEYPDQIATEFELRSRELTDAFESIAKAEYMSAAKKIMAERNIASADLLSQDEQTSIVEEALKLSQSHKSERYRKAEAKLDRFESMASNYASRRQEWLEKYTPAIEGYLRSGHQDDEKDDEKANEPLIVTPAERDVELVPFAHGERNVDPDSNDDLSNESANPNPQEGNMPIPIHPPRGDENPGRCCNIL
jgi:hypothetical protein